MCIVDIEDAKAQLSCLVTKAAEGEPFIIAKAGRPMVRVIPLDVPSAGKTRRIGFLAGQFRVPDDFDRLGEEEIARLFGVG